MILLYINHLGRIQMELRRQGAVDCKTVEGVLHIPNAADEAGLVQRGDLLAEGAAGVIQIPTAQQHMGGELTALQVLGEGHDADIAAVLNGLVVRDDDHRAAAALQRAALQERQVCRPELKVLHGISPPSYGAH